MKEFDWETVGLKVLQSEKCKKKKKKWIWCSFWRTSSSKPLQWENTTGSFVSEEKAIVLMVELNSKYEYGKTQAREKLIILKDLEIVLLTSGIHLVDHIYFVTHQSFKHEVEIENNWQNMNCLFCSCLISLYSQSVKKCKCDLLVQ